MKTPLKLRSRVPVDDKTRELLGQVAKEFRAALRESEGWEDACEKMPKQYQLRRFTHTGVSHIAFKSTKFGFIIKQPYRCDDERPYGAIYTKIIHRSYDGDIFIQPLAYTRTRNKVYKLFLEKVGDDGDLHEGNVGEYNGYAVMFDW